MAADKIAEVDLSVDVAAWLKELDGKRLQLLERLAGASATVSDKTKKVTFELKDGPEEGAASWAEHCLKAAVAMKSGETLVAPALPETGAVWTPPVKVMKIPKDEAKNFLLGKGGARLREISDEMGVIAVFVQEVKPVVEKPFILEVGVLLEAKYEGGERWFEAEVKEVMEDKVKVRWTYDDDVPNSEVPKADVRALPAKAEPIEDEKPELEVGALVEAKFDGKGERMFEAKVIKVRGNIVTVKWTYDEDVPESKLDISEIKCKPKPGTEKLRIYGYGRGLLEAELRVLQCVEMKVPGFAHANVSPSREDTMGVALVIVPLLDNGKFKGKCIGQKGIMRKKVGSACGSYIQYIDNDVFMVGTLSERRRTAALLELVQVQSGGEAAGVPKALEDMCTRILVPDSSSNAVMGSQRANMNRVEEESSTLSFWVPTEKEEEKADEQMEHELTPVVGEIYEARFAHKKGDRWFEAKVLEKIKGDNGTLKYKVEWQYDPDEEYSELFVSDLRKVGSKPGKPEFKPVVGKIYEARFAHPKGDRWFEAKVLKEVQGRDGTLKYKVEWQYDPDEEHSELPVTDLREVGSKPEFKPVVGKIYEARFAHPKGDRWFEAKVLKEVQGRDGTTSKYKVEWQYDPDEEHSELPVTDLREIGSKPAKPVAADRTLAIFGAEASRKAAESMVKDLIAGKDPWPVQKKHKLSDSQSAKEPEPKKSRIVWVVDDAEAERRRKRAARFA